MSTGVTLARPCPACGRDRARPDIHTEGYALVRCRCGLRMLAGGFDAHAAMTANTETYGDEEYNRWYRSMEGVLKQRYRNDLAEIERLVPGKGRILDVGCAYGWFLECARERGWDTAGVEVESATADAARASGLDVRLGTLQDAAFPDASFDVVGLWDVLEHVTDLDAFLSECRRVLKPGGVLAINSPNVRSVMARVAGARWSWLLLPMHVWHFTPSSLRRTLQKRGFAVARAYTWEPTEAFVIDLAKRFPSSTDRRVRRALLPALRLAERAWCAMGRGGLLRVYARRTA
jgi:2-polyprenyl-3-methyl-5-hydroxy-6-metoxy-1,4-benzoquinol methylase